MKIKPLLTGVVILAILAGLAVWLGRRDTGVPPRPELVGRALLQPETLADARRMELRGEADARVVLELTEDGNWFLPDYFGLPADFDKLRRFTQNLLDAKVDRHVTDNPERIGRLELGRHVILLADGEGEEIWRLETGSSGASGGNHIRLSGSESAFLTSTSLFPDTQSRNWPVKQPLSFSVDDVASAKIEFPDGSFLHLQRSDRESDFTSDDLSEHQSVKHGEVTRFLRSLINGRFTEAHPADHPDAVAARKQSRLISLTTFDDRVHTLRVGRRMPEKKATAAVADLTARDRAREEISSSIVFDQDGRIIPEEEIAAIQQKALAERQTEEAPEPEEEEKPGLVFVFYESGGPDFVWPDLMDRVALQFSEFFFNQLPDSMEKLVETRAPPESPGESGDPDS